MNPTTRGQKLVGSLMDLLRMQAVLEANRPTFGRFLGLSVSQADADKDVATDPTVRADRFSLADANGSTDHTSLVFRYRFPACNRLQNLHELDLDHNHSESESESNTMEHGNRAHARASTRSPVGLSTYASILDEVTTYSILAAAGTKRPRPGVSVTIQSQWGPGAPGNGTGPSSPPSQPEEVDIVTTLTKKGRSLAFVRAEVRDPSNNDGVICHFDHVKYLSVGWVMSLVLSPLGLWILDFYLKYLLPHLGKRGSDSDSGSGSDNRSTQQPPTGIMDSFRKTGDTTATFRFGPQHANGFGGLHGGVQAILMERLGQAVAKQELGAVAAAGTAEGTADVRCQRLQISYQSSASRQLDLRAYVIDPPRPDHPSVTLRIEIVRSTRTSNGNGNGTDPGHTPSKKVVVSEGILTFAAASSSKSKVQ
eukprot:jgi/Psemu1/298691/fgenesh1_pm.688_\